MGGEIDERIHSTQTDYSLFISDLHLSEDRPEITKAFLLFLEKIALKAEALYILGDLFEYWAGDDEINDSHHILVITALKNLSDSGVKIYFMHGNRDFLISENFCKATNSTLLKDPVLINLYGGKILLSHGDDLCTDDSNYQLFRKQVRNEIWQRNFLSQSLKTRKEQISSLRLRSELEKSQKSMIIMDVNQNAVATLLKFYNYPSLFIHGHTHRPNHHKIQLDGHTISRWVLGDWYENGSYLKIDKNGINSELL